MKTTVTNGYMTMGLPPVVANKTLPLDKRMRMEERGRSAPVPARPAPVQRRP